MSRIASHFHESWKAAEELWRDPQFVDQVEAVVDRICASLRAGGKVMAVGNGGSAADAQHFVAELVGKYKQHNRAPLAAVALTTDPSVVSALANDYAWEMVFERQLQALAKPGDVLLAISTSGTSVNVLNVLYGARLLRVFRVGLTNATGGGMPPLCNVCVRVPAHETPIVQQLHGIVCHAICDAVEERML